MALQTDLGSVFVLANNAPGSATFRGSALATGDLQFTAASVADTWAGPSSVKMVGVVAVGATLAAAIGTRRRRQKVTRNFFGGGNTSSAPAFDPATQLGAQDPVGFWDPAGYMADKDETKFKDYRQKELKHGRIAMLATMGYITPEITGKIPGFLAPNEGLAFADIPNGIQAIAKVPALGWAQILAYMAFCEVSQDQSPGTTASSGDFGWLTQYYTDTRRNAELANGRLAMMAFVGMVFQDGLTGSAWGDWALYTASPLRCTASPSQ